MNKETKEKFYTLLHDKDFNNVVQNEAYQEIIVEGNDESCSVFKYKDMILMLDVWFDEEKPETYLTVYPCVNKELEIVKSKSEDYDFYYDEFIPVGVFEENFNNGNV